MCDTSLKVNRVGGSLDGQSVGGMVNECGWEVGVAPVCEGGR